MPGCCRFLRCRDRPGEWGSGVPRPAQPAAVFAAPLLPSLRRRPGWVSAAAAQEVLAAQAPRTVAAPARRRPRPGRGPAGPRGLCCVRGPPGALPRPPQRDSARAACPRPEAQPGPGPSGLCPLGRPRRPRLGPRPRGAAGGTPAAPHPDWGSSAGGFTGAVSTGRRDRPGRALALQEQLGCLLSFLGCFIVLHNCSERCRWRLILRVVARCVWLRGF